jgi:flagellar biosynthesis component FlhA
MTVLMLDPEFEYRLSAQWLGGEGRTAPDPRVVVHVRERIETYVRSVSPGQAAIVCTAPFRRTLADLVERFSVDLRVFAFGELPAEIDVRPVSIVEDPERGAEEPLAVGA